MQRIPTALISAIGMIAAYATVVASGSRPLGGVVLAIFGLSCIAVWSRRDDRATTVRLTAIGLLAFVLSHVLALAVGAWPAVLIAAAAVAAACWSGSDVRHLRTRAVA